MVEQWRKIEGFDGKYEVSSLGRVRSYARADRGQEARMLEPLIIGGYRSVCIRWHGKNIFKRIGRLVAAAFIKKTDENKIWVNHKNGKRQDDRLENLEWVTPRENTQHAFANGLKKARRTAKELAMSKEKTYGKKEGKEGHKKGGKKAAAEGSKA